MLDTLEWSIIGRTLLSYIVIVIIFRLMGKREIGELSIIDLVVYLMLAEIAVFSIEDPSSHLLHFIVPMVILLIIQRSTAFLSLKFPKLRNLMEGKPSIIINRGRIDEHQMRRQRYSFSDLQQQLRENGTKSVQDVDFAILETSGELSVFEKKDTADGSSGFVPPLIIDGEIQQDVLDELGKSEPWLRSQMKRHGHPDIHSISYCTLDKNHDWYIDRKDER
ncbi:Uncharacterized membrane protein YcaP, DUF421 family [Terribacillus halophilus]|uniref:Uncharacterized membrane protein YcaP, DUF421 family n=1 Tax=Terribacillus halophilus TaxID=361279 RepID=A0A1G6SKX3_9BACI|nr:Uncharacterized membrane protein YcaP, DUF421 family [Terribacillus halophilus]